MYIRLKPNIYSTLFKDSLILLDLKKDNFYVLNFDEYQLLKTILLTPWFLDKKGALKIRESMSALNEDMTEFANHLLQLGVISHPLYPDASPLSASSDATGAHDIDWRLPLDQITKFTINRDAIFALYLLILTHMRVKFGGLHRLVTALQKKAKKIPHLRLPNESDINTMVHAVNKACLYFPKRTKCLEWACTLVDFSLSKGFQLTLNIGVQNYPFLSHAWVECEHTVLYDNPNLSKELSVILRIPLFEPP